MSIRHISDSAWTVCLSTLFSLALPSAAASQTPAFREGQLVRMFVPETIVDEPNYAILEMSSPNNRNKAKQVEVACPNGMRAMSAGFSAASGRGEPDDWRVILSMPMDDGKGWLIHAMFDGSGDRDRNGVHGVPAPYEWILKLRIVCARIG